MQGGDVHTRRDLRPRGCRRPANLVCDYIEQPATGTVRRLAKLVLGDPGAPGQSWVGGFRHSTDYLIKQLIHLSIT